MVRSTASGSLSHGRFQTAPGALRPRGAIRAPSTSAGPGCVHPEAIHSTHRLLRSTSVHANQRPLHPADLQQSP